MKKHYKLPAENRHCILTLSIEYLEQWKCSDKKIYQNKLHNIKVAFQTIEEII